MTDFIIETNQLTKSFKGQAALRGVDLQVPVGSIFGFLGRNGAGKTTTSNTLLGVQMSDSGSASLFGLPVEDGIRSAVIRRRIGFVTEDKGGVPIHDGGADHSLHAPFFPKMARGSGTALSPHVRTSAREEDPGSLQGNAFQADVAAGDRTRRRTADSSG